MLDIGWAELLVIGALALIVVGPKDLPGMLRNVGRFVARARGMAREFQGAMEDAAREADLADVANLKKDVSKWSSDLRSASPQGFAKRMMEDDGKPAAKTSAEPSPGSLDAADAAENAAWEADRAEKAAESARAEALRAAEAKAEAEAERIAAVNRSAAELEAEIARDEAAEKKPAPPAAGA